MVLPGLGGCNKSYCRILVALSGQLLAVTAWFYTPDTAQCLEIVGTARVWAGGAAGGEGGGGGQG